MYVRLYDTHSDFLQGVWSTPPANERKLNDAYRVSICPLVNSRHVNKAMRTICDLYKETLTAYHI